MVKDKKMMFSSKFFKFKSQLKRAFKKTISRRVYLIIFSFHLLVIGLILIAISEIDYYIFNYNLTGGIVGLSYVILVRTVLLFFNYLLGSIIDFPKISILNDEDIFLPLSALIYFFVGLLWLQYKKNKEITSGFLILSILITWIILIAISLLIFPTQWAE